MTLPRPGARFRLIDLAVALLAVVLLVAACGAPAAGPTAVPATTAPADTTTATQAPATTVATSVADGDIPVGVDAEGNFYRGDPNAAVKLTEFSDFQ